MRENETISNFYKQNNILSNFSTSLSLEIYREWINIYSGIAVQSRHDVGEAFAVLFNLKNKKMLGFSTNMP